MNHPNSTSLRQPHLLTQIINGAQPAFSPEPAIPTSHQPPITLAHQTQSPANSSQQPEQQMQKNRLQEFTHKLNIPLPVYHTVNEGSPHLPKFRSTVIVDGVKFTSPNTFSTRKAAEKDVAELALKHVSQKMIVEDFPQPSPQDLSLIQEDTVFCKSILNEFATKMNVGRPTYTTVGTDGLLPTFVSSLVFNGVPFTGTAAKSKKEAEQLAARAVILSFLGESAEGKVLCEIIKSKVKLYAALHKVNVPTTSLPLVMKCTQNLETLLGKNVGVEGSAPIENASITSASFPTVSSVAAKLDVPIGNAQQPRHDLNIRKLESSSETTNPTAISARIQNDSLIAGSSPAFHNVAPNHPVPVGNAQPKHDFKLPIIVSPSEAMNPIASACQTAKLPIEFAHASSSPSLPNSSKKRRKNKKKANKRLCTDAQLPMADLPLNQGPPCSVAQ